MARVCLAAGLAFAVFTLCGCSNIQRVDLSQWQPYTGKDPYTGDDVSRRVKASSRASRSTVARDLIQQAEREEATYARSEFRPWIRVDTNEPEELEADVAAQDRRLKEANQGICRGC